MRSLDRRMLFREIRSSLNEKGKVFVAEPAKRVTADEFIETLSIADKTGLVPDVGWTQIKGFRGVLLVRRSEKTLTDKKEMGV